MFESLRLPTLACFAIVLVMACDAPEEGRALPGPDAKVREVEHPPATEVDAGASDEDASTSSPDGAVSEEDAGASPHDGGAPLEDAGTTPTDGGAPPQDAGSTSIEAPIGGACSAPADCSGEGAACFSGTPTWWDAPFSGGYCTLPGCGGGCPSGSTCVQVTGGDTFCAADCQSDGQCRSGYGCYQPGVCMPEATAQPGASPVGGACATGADCAGSTSSCVPETGANGPTGFTGGYCTIFDCSAQNPCPSGSTCYQVASDGGTACLANCTQRSHCRGSDYACHQPGACLPACTATSCGNGQVCGPDGLCVSAPCTPTSCGNGLVCDQASGQCVVNIGTPPAGPIPDCSGVATWQCSGTSTYCGELLPFLPENGPGYTNYPLNGETASNQYRSYLRRDVTMLVKYAAARVACLSANWTVGNGHPIGLGDMSEANGAIPGTSVGSPGHPAGTHVNGRDIDIAYHQLTGANNHLRAVCPHTTNGQDQYHCTGAPNNLDVWRTALFIASFHASPNLRVIGVDGRIGPLVESAITQLCAGGWVNNGACSSLKMTYEVTDTGRGWFRFHHHHLHVSVSAGSNFAPIDPSRECLTPSCDGAEHDLLHHDD